MPEVGGKVLDSVKTLILPELAVIKQDLAVISSRLAGIDKRFDDLRQDLNQRLKELRDDLDTRISDFRGDVNQRWGEFRLDLKQSFEKKSAGDSEQAGSHYGEYHRAVDETRPPGSRAGAIPG